MNPRAFLGSTLLHAGVIWLLFFVTPASRPHPVSVIQVALVNLPQGALKMPAGEPVDVPPPPETKQPVAKTPAETPPVKNAIRPPDAKAPLPKRPVAGVPSGLKTETASLGAPGLSGDVSVDAADFAFTYYLLAVRNQVGQNWGAPAGLETRGNAVRCTVYFKIDRLGRVSDVQLEESSGVKFFDDSAVRAVSVSSPLPPLPDGYGKGALGVHFGFQFKDR